MHSCRVLRALSITKEIPHISFAHSTSLRAGYCGARTLGDELFRFVRNMVGVIRSGLSIMSGVGAHDALDQVVNDADDVRVANDGDLRKTLQVQSCYGGSHGDSFRITTLRSIAIRRPA